MSATDAWQYALERIESDWPTQRHRGLGVLVGCSGGADSVLLVRALHHLRRRKHEHETGPTGELCIAHFNHRLRDDDSEQDEQFVRDLGRQLDLPVFVCRATSLVHDEQGTRNQRRKFFAETCQKTGSRYIALGHNLSDNVETVLHRLMRGTGPVGMNGIRQFRPLSNATPENDFVISRPLLGLMREEIRQAMRAVGYPWREDTSNDSSRYDRNWIRNELLPLMRQQYPDTDQAISRFIRAQQQWSSEIDHLADTWLDEVVVKQQPLTIHCRGGDSGDGDVPNQPIVVEGLRKCWMARQWPLQPMTQKHWDLAYKMIVNSEPPAITLPGNIQFRRSGNQVLVEREPTKIVG